MQLMIKCNINKRGKKLIFDKFYDKVHIDTKKVLY